MSENTKMQDIMMQKVSANHEFWGWYLKCFMQNKGWQEDDMIAFLKTNKDNFFRLAMCRAPKSDEKDFSTLVTKIAAFTEINVFTLANLIREVDSVNLVKHNSESARALLAARQRRDKEDESN